MVERCGRPPRIRSAELDPEPAPVGGRGTFVGRLAESSSNFAVSSSRPPRSSALCFEAQALTCRIPRRVAQYASASASRHRLGPAFHAHLLRERGPPEAERRGRALLAACARSAGAGRELSPFRLSRFCRRRIRAHRRTDQHHAHRRFPRIDGREPAASGSGMSERAARTAHSRNNPIGSVRPSQAGTDSRICRSAGRAVLPPPPVERNISTSPSAVALRERGPDPVSGVVVTRIQTVLGSRSPAGGPHLERLPRGHPRIVHAGERQDRKDTSCRPSRDDMAE